MGVVRAPVREAVGGKDAAERGELVVARAHEDGGAHRRDEGGEGIPGEELELIVGDAVAGAGER